MNKNSFVLFLFVALSACGGSEKNTAAQSSGPAKDQLPEVEVVRAVRASATLTQDLPGRLAAYRSAQVRARVEGIVEKRLFEEGSDVQAGQLLFAIDDRVFRTARAAAAAEVEAARLLVERYKPLIELKAVSQQEFDAALARLKQAEAQLARAELDLENTRVPAPIAGRIGRALVTEGALVGKGEATHLVTIEQIDPIYVNFTQPGADLLRLQAALKAGRLVRAQAEKIELFLEDGRRYEHTGKLIFSDLAVDPSTGAVAMRALFPNPKRELLPGMFVRVRFPYAVAEQTLRVPQRAVQGGPQGQLVMVVGEEGEVKARVIKTAGMVEGDFLVAEGLQEGEQVIVAGLQKARPGTKVKAVPVGQGGPIVPSPPQAPPQPK
ncbi:MAG: efflux RND transporter periplasmic adaptor subunit [Rhodocyclaceae bacterium]|nr:efflux RND transporter periplasmic adaptor subunit [Rhodocyclaceae bacterium]